MASIFQRGGKLRDLVRISDAIHPDGPDRGQLGKAQPPDRTQHRHIPGGAPPGTGCRARSGDGIWLRAIHPGFRAVTGLYWDPSKVSFKTKHIGGIPSNYENVQIAYSGNSGIEISFPVEWLFRELQLDIQVANGRTSGASPEVTIVTALRSALGSHLDQKDLGPAAVANLLGLEADHLVKALKQIKTTLPKEIKRLKIDRAKEALSRGDETIAGIGVSLGYRDHAHFTRFFRSQTGMTPNAFRKQAASPG